MRFTRLLAASLSTFALATLSLACDGGGGSGGTGGGGSGGGGAGGGGAGGSGGNAGGSGGNVGGSGGNAGGSGGNAGGSGGSGGAMMCDTVVPPPSAAMVDVTITALDPLSGTGTANLTVKACAKADTTCAAPLDTTTTNAQGQATVTVPTGAAGFDGFLEVTGAQVKASLVFGSVPIVQNESLSIVAISSFLFSQLAQQYGVMPDPQKGHIAAVLYECSAVGAWDNAAQGAVLGCTPAPGDIGYTNGMLPAPNATSTDASGAAVAVNVDPGTATVTNTDPMGNVIGTAQVLVRADTITQVALGSTP